MRAPLKVAVVDDEADLRAALCETLTLEDLETIDFAGVTDALKVINTDFPGIVITDLRMPERDGRALFDHLAKLDPELPVIILSGHGDMETAVDLVRRGAYDFLAKPFDVNALLISVRRALEKRALVLENRTLRDVRAVRGESAFLGDSEAAKQVRATLDQLAQADIDVLIEGEIGTGKTLAAGWLHRHSARARRPLVAVDCAALPPDHADSILFGHVSGAHAGAASPRSGQVVLANGGTLFLDNIDRLDMRLQTGLLRVIDQGNVIPVGGTQPMATQFRAVAATSVNLDQLAGYGNFSAALFFRLAGFRLSLPPLRARRDDVYPMFRAFLAEEAAQLDRDLPVVTAEIWRWLGEHDWPGNTRELRNFARTVVLGLPLNMQRADAAPVEDAGLRDAVARFEAETIRATLIRASGDAAEAIAALKLPRKTFYDKLTRYKIDISAYREGRRQ
jgi:two-component system, NtrC family, C4-dicarboxylate transport response regulator DctD